MTVRPSILGWTACAILTAAAGVVCMSHRRGGERAAPVRSGGQGVELANDARRRGFREVALASGIDFRMNFLPWEQGAEFKVNMYDHGCGVAVGDCNGDGFDDVYFCNQLGSNALYLNDGSGQFTNVTSQSGPIALADRISVGATFADYDNDGDQDLFVTSTRGGNCLFQNDGCGVFRDVTREAGVDLIAHSQTGAFFDYDLDGDLDLIVTNTAEWTKDYDARNEYFRGPSDFYAMAASPIELNVAYRNCGNGTFVDVSEEIGLRGVGWAGDTAVFDYDDDGRLDLLVTNMFGRSQLYRNGPEGRFVDVTAEVLKRTSWGAIGTTSFDFNNDGRLDLCIVDMHSDMWVTGDALPASIDARRKYDSVAGGQWESNPEEAEKLEQLCADAFRIDYAQVLFGNSLHKNLGNAKFEEVSDRAGAETFWPWGIVAGDFDSDSHQDLFLPSGMGHPYFYWPNALLMNTGNEQFAELSAVLGVEPPPGGEHLPHGIGGRPAARGSRCAVASDLDGDGRLDLIVNNFNDRPYYFRNEFPRQHFLKFRLRGTSSNRDAIGATVRICLGDQTLVRQVNAAGGYLSHSSKTLHFGLGMHVDAGRVEVRWPSGAVQYLESPEVDRLYEVTEVAVGPGLSGFPKDAHHH
jgi:enediyne biosynthesis protein E4